MKKKEKIVINFDELVKITNYKQSLIKTVKPYQNSVLIKDTNFMLIIIPNKNLTKKSTRVIKTII